MTKSVALYARVSSERQVQQSTIDSQLVAVRECAVQDGFVVLPSDEYADNGYSGSTLRRPALERLRDRIAEGFVDVVYVHNPDRLARRHAHRVLLLEEFSARGVRVVMLQGRNGESPEDQLLTQVQGVIAEYERAKIMERSRRGKLHKVRAGSVNVLSNAPYGYLYVKKSDSAPARFQIALHEARGVRRIFEAVVREHKPLYAVASMLEREEGAAARRGQGRPLAALAGHDDSQGAAQSELRGRSGIWKDGARRISAAASDHRSLRHSPPCQERVPRARTRALDPDRRAADRVG